MSLYRRAQAEDALIRMLPIAERLTFRVRRIEDLVAARIAGGGARR